MAAEINNVAYSWSMIQLQTNFDGESAQAPIFVDCTAIKWDTKRKIESKGCIYKQLLLNTL